MSVTVNDLMYSLNLVLDHFEPSIFLAAVSMITFSIAMFIKRIIVGYK